jgi:hypothetical protein
MPTFAELEAPFPLFEAPVDDASAYVGTAVCSLCGRSGRPCFELGVGCALMLDCSSCATENGLDASDRKDADCRSCGKPIRFPRIAGERVLCCHGCLRAGRAAMTQDTELGMISWEQAFEGVTLGLPGLRRSDFELVPREEGWTAARLPRETLFELLRTPTYSTWQGERWLFCCR